MQQIIEFVGRFWNESSLYWWAMATVIGVTVEYFFQPKDTPAISRLFNLRYGAIYLITGFFLAPLAVGAANAISAKLGTGLINLDVFSTTQLAPQIAAAIALVLAQDFFYYWAHRAQHVWPWLWHQHSLHHSDESMNVTTGFRHHWLETFVQIFMVSLPFTIFIKLSPVTLSWYISIVVAWTFIIHLNVKWGLGRWSWLLVTPQTHRIHHSRLEPHWDKNFAAYFPVWDIVFGTYYAPQPNEYPPTGLSSGRKIETVGDAIVYPFTMWIADAKTYLARRKRDPAGKSVRLQGIGDSLTDKIPN